MTVEGRIEEIYIENGVTKGRVRVNGKRVSVALTLLLNARAGDEVVIQSGFAFPRRSHARQRENELVNEKP